MKMLLKRFLAFCAVSPLLPLACFPDAEPEELEALRSEISRHDRLYFEQNNPEISDREYDLLKTRLSHLQNNASAASIGDDRLSGHPKARHESPMLSLEKTNPDQGLISFRERVLEYAGNGDTSLVIEPKVDGIAINLVYINGRLEKALSRGDGREGDDLTPQVLQLPSVPGFLQGLDGTTVPDRVEIRGEIYIEKETFDRINQERNAKGESGFSTPRNFAAGSIRLNNLDEVRERCLQLVVFDYGAWIPFSSRPESHLSFLGQAENWGFEVLDTVLADPGHDLTSAAVRELERNEDSRLPCDGIVIKVNDQALRDRMGRSDSAPKWAVACKFQPPSAPGIVRSIQIQVGRTGNVTPVAILEPVVIGNRTITRINLHNPVYLSALDVCVGDRVEVELSGDVIPLISKVHKDARSAGGCRYVFPKACPFCSHAFTKSSDGTAIYCPNYTCPERTRRRLRYFADEIGLLGWGPSRIAKVVESGGVSTYVDLVLQDAESVTRLKTVPLWKVIVALGIPGIGPGRARELAMALDSLGDLLDVEDRDLESRGLSPSIKTAVVRSCEDPEMRKELAELVQVILN